MLIPLNLGRSRNRCITRSLQRQVLDKNLEHTAIEVALFVGHFFFLNGGAA